MSSNQIIDYLYTQPMVSVLVAGACLGVGFTLLRTRRTQNPLPPGPPGLPLVGNAYDVPEKQFWLKYMEWSKEYNSDVIHLNMLGTPYIVLNSQKAARDLLESRSSIYSSRPNMPMTNDLIGFTWHFAFMEYGNRWRERRALFSQVFRASQADVVWRPALQTVVKTLLNQLLDDPDHFLDHGRSLSGAFILNITYGLDIKSDNNTYIQQAERGMQAMAAAATANAYLVDSLPSLKYVPSWFPGAQFQRDAKAWNKDVTAMAYSPLQYVKDALLSARGSFDARGDAVPCAATALLEQVEASKVQRTTEEKESVVRDVLAATFAAGSDTTVSSFGTFILAMLQNPGIQKKAQAAVDAAISLNDGLPDYTMFGQLPYIEALVREILRWRPVAPVAAPHAVIQDDVYKGYHIPKGATVIGNTWAILHDPEVYGPNTDKFDPSRFMNASQTAIDPKMPLALDSFGFGRRICPGLHIAHENIWLAVVSVLATFDIKPMDGHPPEEAGEYTSGLLCHPLPFKCRFVPRSELAVQAIRGN